MHPVACPGPRSPQVASQFSSKYYNVLEKHPNFISRFYKDDSTLTVTNTAANTDNMAVGVEVRRPGSLICPTLNASDRRAN